MNKAICFETTTNSQHKNKAIGKNKQTKSERQQWRWQALGMDGSAGVGMRVSFAGLEAFYRGRERCFNKIPLAVAFAEKHNYLAWLFQASDQEQDNEKRPNIKLVYDMWKNMPHINSMFFKEMTGELNKFTKHKYKSAIALEVKYYMVRTMQAASRHRAKVYLKFEVLPGSKLLRMKDESECRAFRWLNAVCVRVFVSSFQRVLLPLTPDMQAIWHAKEEHSMQTCGMW